MPQIDIDEEVIYLDLVDEKVVVSTTKEITILENGTKIGTTRAIDFIPGANVTMDVAQAGSKISVTISSTGGGGGSGGHTIKGNGTAVTQRTGLNFSDKFTVSDDAGNDETDVTVNLTKSDVGLSNVDNTADADKPVSTAQALADTAVASAAASDATTKANTAQSAAISAAATDATTKANAALASALSADPVKATSAELQVGTNDTKFATALGLAGWWTWIKTQAQTFANITATILKVSGQAAGEGTHRLVAIDDTGAIVSDASFIIDPTNKRITITAVNALSSGYSLLIQDNSLNQILKVRNDQVLEIGGTFLIQVPAGTSTGAALIKFIANQAQALRFGDGSTTWVNLCSTTGDESVDILKKIKIDQGVGCVTYFIQYGGVTSSTNSGTTSHASISVPSGYGANAVLDILCVASDGTTVGGQVRSTFKNVSGTLSRIAQTKSIHNDGARTDTVDLNADNTNDNIDIDFTNDASGKAFDYCYDLKVQIAPFPS